MTSGTDIVNKAAEQLGKPYSFGATGPDLWDCSSLVQWAYGQYGISTPRTTWDMVGSGSNLVPIQQKELQPGDLVFSHWTDPTPNSHVAMYVGNNRIIEAGDPVQFTELGPDYLSHVDQFRRVPGLDGDPGSGIGAFITGAVAGVQQVIGPAGQLFNWVKPTNVTDAIDNAGRGIAGIGSSVAQVGNLATLVTKMFLPSNLLRAAFLGAGAVFILIGIWFLSRQIKD